MKKQLLILIIGAMTCQKVLSQDTLLTAKKTLDTAASAIKDGNLNKIQLSIITAGSLDFFGNQSFKKFTGQLSLYFPRVVWQGIGMEVGIYTRNYYTADSTVRIQSYNITKDPSIYPLLRKDTTKYSYKDIATTSRTTFAVTGAYINPFFTLFKPNIEPDWDIRFCPALDIEVVSVATSKLYYYTLKDSVERTFSVSDKDKTFAKFDPRVFGNLINSTTVRGYFGVGFKIFCNAPSILDFTLQAYYGGSIQGISNDNPNPEASIQAPVISKIKEINGYYLCKGAITERYSKLNGSVGVEVRGFLPNNVPSIAAYLGIKIGIDKFFSGKP